MPLSTRDIEYNGGNLAPALRIVPPIARLLARYMLYLAYSYIVGSLHRHRAGGAHALGRALHNKNGDGVRFCCHSIVKRRLLFMLSGGGCVRELSQVMSHFQGPHVCIIVP